jgi:hypothetical protein
VESTVLDIIDELTLNPMFLPHIGTMAFSRPIVDTWDDELTASLLNELNSRGKSELGPPNFWF